MCRKMCTSKNQTSPKNINSNQHPTLIPILLTHTNFNSCLNNIFMNRFYSMNPFFTYENYHEKTYHLDFLHEYELGLGGRLKGELGLQSWVYMGLL